jgi:hypothetical protein
MSNTLSKLLVFAAGAAIGSFVTWKLVKEKYERKADEEIESIKQLYVYRNIHKQEKEPAKETPEETHDRDYAKDYSAGLGYIQEDNDREEMADVCIYTIEPGEYGEFEDYQTLSFNYYSDGVLTNDAGVPMTQDDIQDIVGYDFSDAFGEYEPDLAYIRNDRLKADIEILKEDCPYA